MTIRHDIIRLWKSRIDRYKNNAMLSLPGIDGNMWSGMAVKLQEKLDRLQAMSDLEFHNRFVVDKESLDDYTLSKL